jgi:hypothetical protein
MPELIHSQLSAWGNFYVIVGSSGAALVGLQFVVVTLIADTHKRMADDSVGAFGTPTVVHFVGALLVAAIMSAPWPALLSLSVALVVYGLGGLAYDAVVIRRARRQTNYTPVWEDWLWYALLPCGIDAALVLAALFLPTAAQPAMFVIGFAALSLLFVGIHNAWDAVTYHLRQLPEQGD